MQTREGAKFQLWFTVVVPYFSLMVQCKINLTKLPYFTTRQLKGQELIVSFLTTLPNKGLKKPDRSNLLTHAVKTVITGLNDEVTSETTTPSSHEEWKQKMKLWHLMLHYS
jgi:hypothetical protein